MISDLEPLWNYIHLINNKLLYDHLPSLSCLSVSKNKQKAKRET